MKYQIHQIKDIKNCMYAFIGWDIAKEKFDSKDYRLVYSGVLDNEYNSADASTLNHLYEVFNIRHPKDFTGHSLSVSDVIVLTNDKGERKIYYCDSFGWETIENAQFPNRMNYDEMVEYLLDELKDERNKMLMNKENRYSYIFMLCNDMGIVEGQ